MCEVTSSPEIVSVRLTIEEARRVGNLNIDIDSIEVTRFRRKIRDAVRDYDMRRTDQEFNFNSLS